MRRVGVRHNWNAAKLKMTAKEQRHAAAPELKRMATGV
jgi:hypothetical protein